MPRAFILLFVPSRLINALLLIFCGFVLAVIVADSLASIETGKVIFFVFALALCVIARLAYRGALQLARRVHRLI